MNDKFNIVENIEVVHRNSEGKILSKRQINSGFLHKLLVMLGLKHNCITDDGFANVAGLILEDIGGTAYDFLAIGIGTTAADHEDVALQTPKGVRKAAVGTLVTITEPDDTAQLVYTFSQANDATLTGTDAITEIGVFHAATGDNVMLLRQVYSPADNCDWDAGDTLQVTVKVQIMQGS